MWVLVDRLWPRGLSKEKTQVHWWAKEPAPCDPLRRFFAHDPGKYPGFLRRHQKELKGHPALERLRALIQEKTVALLFAAREEPYHNARALPEILGQEQEP